MAGENKHWYESTLTTTLANAGLLMVGVSNDVGGWLTRNITKENFLKELKAIVDGIVTTGSSIQKVLIENVSTDQVIVFAANSKKDSLDFKKISGTPFVKIGTTLGGDELLTDTQVGTNGESFDLRGANINQTTIYVGISGGTVSIAKWYYSNVF